MVKSMMGSTQARAVILLLSLTLGSVDLAMAAPQKAQDTSRHLYDRVMEEFRGRDYEAALAGFRLFLELHSSSALAANAQYWIGECQYRMRRYKDALTSFYNVVSYYPLSQKLPVSTLRIGQTYTKLADHEKARLMYERVIEQYPNSPESELAQKAIEAIMAKEDPQPQQQSGSEMLFQSSPN